MTDKNRRKFVTMMGAGAAVVPLSALVGSLPSHAQDDLPLVDPESAQAQALQYIESSDKDGQLCSNCSLYQGAEGSEQGPCPLFPGNAVLAGAWCSAYVPKA
mgnify:CR=1 FL=1